MAKSCALVGGKQKTEKAEGLNGMMADEHFICNEKCNFAFI